MTTLAEHVENYLTVRRSLGFKLVGEGVLLAEFVACAERAGQRTVTIEFAVQWARRPANGSHNYLSRRLRVVRTFARYLHALDPSCEVPSLELLPAKKYRPAPYVYTDAEIAALMAATSTLSPPFRAATFRTLIGLLACTGLRMGEALGLDRVDVDLADSVLMVRNAKFGKSREVLLHPSTMQALLEYAELRDRFFPQPTTPSFLLTTRGTQAQSPTDLPAVPQTGEAGRDHAPIARPPSSGSRPETSLRCDDAAGLVSRRRRRSSADAAAEHVYGALCG